MFGVGPHEEVHRGVYFLVLASGWFSSTLSLTPKRWHFFFLHSPILFLGSSNYFLFIYWGMGQQWKPADTWHGSTCHFHTTYLHICFLKKIVHLEPSSDKPNLRATYFLWKLTFKNAEYIQICIRNRSRFKLYLRVTDPLSTEWCCEFLNNSYWHLSQINHWGLTNCHGPASLGLPQPMGGGGGTGS